MNHTVKAHSILISSTLIAGCNFSISKLSTPAFISATAVVLLRDISSVLFFGALYLIFVREKIDKKDIFPLIVCGFFGMASNQLLFYEGLTRTSPINAALMMTGSPVLVLLISVALAKEKLTLLKMSGIILSGTGVALLVISSSTNGIEQLYSGDILVLINAFCWGVFVVKIKTYAAKYHILTLMAFLFFWGTLFVLPFGYSDLMAVEWNKFTSTAMASLVFIIVAATLINYFLNTYVMKLVNPSLAGSYIYLQPVLATIVAILIGQDMLTFQKFALSLLIFTGVYLVSRKQQVS